MKKFMLALLLIIFYFLGFIAIFYIFTFDKITSSSEFYLLMLAEIIWMLVFSWFVLREYLNIKMTYIIQVIILIIFIILEIIFGSRVSSGDEFGSIEILILFPPVICGLLFTKIYGKRIINKKQ